MKVGMLALLLAVCLALLPAFREKSQINSRAVVTALGIDTGTTGECYLSVQSIEMLKTAGSLKDQNENATAVHTAGGRSVAEALHRFVTTTGQRAYLLHNRAIVISLQQIRQQPLPELLSYFVRSHEARPTVELVVSRDTAAALLEIPSGSHTIPAEHMTLFLREGSRMGLGVQTDLLDAERAQSGMYDVMLPIVRAEKEEMHMDGTAVFRQGVFAGELDEAATRGVLFARDDMEQCLYTVEGKTIEIPKSNTTVSLRKQGTAILYTLKVRCQAKRTDGDGKIPKALLAAAIEQDIRSALNTTIMNWDCDVCGFGRLAKKQLPEVVKANAGFLRESSFSVEVLL